MPIGCGVAGALLIVCVAYAIRTCPGDKNCSVQISAPLQVGLTAIITVDNTPLLSSFIILLPKATSSEKSCSHSYTIVVRFLNTNSFIKDINLLLQEVTSPRIDQIMLLADSSDDDSD